MTCMRGGCPVPPEAPRPSQACQSRPCASVLGRDGLGGAKAGPPPNVLMSALFWCAAADEGGTTWALIAAGPPGGPSSPADGMREIEREREGRPGGYDEGAGFTTRVTHVRHDGDHVRPRSAETKKRGNGRQMAEQGSGRLGRGCLFSCPSSSGCSDDQGLGLPCLPSLCVMGPWNRPQQPGAQQTGSPQVTTLPMSSSSLSSSHHGLVHGRVEPHAQQDAWPSHHPLTVRSPPLFWESIAGCRR